MNLKAAFLMNGIKKSSWKFTKVRLYFLIIEATAIDIPEPPPSRVDWLTKPSFKTGDRLKIKDEKGKEREVDEILSPLELIMENAGDLVYAKLMGKIGGDRRNVDAVQGDIIAGLSNPASPLAGLLNSVNPRLLDLEIKDGDDVLILLDQVGPLISRWIEKKLKTPQSGSLGGAGL